MAICIYCKCGRTKKILSDKDMKYPNKIKDLSCTKCDSLWPIGMFVWVALIYLIVFLLRGLFCG